MTLQELSVEMGKPTHVLANTLRQVGLADHLLTGNEQLNPAQISRLRNGKNRQIPETDTKTEILPLSIAALAEKYGRGLADMINIVKMSKLMSDVVLSSNTVLPREVWNEMESKLNDKRICLRNLAKELGVDPSQLAQAAYKDGWISSVSCNQKIDKDTESKIRLFFCSTQSDERNSQNNTDEDEKELRDLHEYLDGIEYPDIEEDKGDEYIEDEVCIEDDYIEDDFWSGELSESEPEEEYTVSSLAKKLGISEHQVINILNREFFGDYKFTSDSPIPSEIVKKIETYDWLDYNEDETASYTVESLAIELGIAEGRVVNILRNAYTIEDSLSGKSLVEDYIAEDIIRYFDLQSHHNQAQLFANNYLRGHETVWNNPIVSNNTSEYKPGSVIEGKVLQIDFSQKTIKVEFEEKYSFFLFSKSIIRHRRLGLVTFDEWDWELEFSRELPNQGQKYEFLILRNTPGEDLILSRRQILKPPTPCDGFGRVLCHDENGHFLYVRHDNGSYGFIPYMDLPSFNVEDGDILHLKLAKRYKKQFGKQTFLFAQYEVGGEKVSPYYNELWQGLNIWSWPMGNEVNSWLKILNSYEYGGLILGRITDTNSGGYLLETIGDSSFELFCPYSKAPIWIDKNVSDKLIGAIWLLKIESDPEEDENNLIAFAKLDGNVYDKAVKKEAYYNAIVCSCNEYGANALIEGCVPAFIPNKFIDWGRDNSAEKQLTPGEKVIIKVISTEKRIIASIRDAYINPWLQVSSKFPLGKVLDTSVVHAEKGFFRVDLGEYTGHLPIGEVSWMEYINDCREYALPNPLRVVVKGYDEKSQLVQVSIKALTRDPWTELDKHLPDDKIVTAEITGLSNGGAWLKVGESGFKGYLSYRDIDWCRDIDKTSFPYSIDDKVKVKITHINSDRRQLACSLKVLIPNPWKALAGKEKVEGEVVKVSDTSASVRLAGGIECTCYEVLDSDFEGQTLIFCILQLNIAAQRIVISYRNREIKDLNTLAVGEMFKKYRNLSDGDKRLIEESNNEEEVEVYRNFIIKEVSSTGRVTAVYAEDDGEYENGILLPGSVTIYGNPVNVIFARQIIKQYIIPGEKLEFKVTHRYEGFNYAVLTLDAAPLLDLNNIATDDLSSLAAVNGVEAKVLHDICTSRNLFVSYRGYFGYVPRIEVSELADEDPDTIRVRSVIAPEHPGQMIRFAPISKEELEKEIKEQEIEKELIKGLDRDLYDCYEEINSLSGFNPRLPDYYPFALQLRYDPGKQEELSELLASEQTYFSSQTFFLDCFRAKGGKGYVLNLFNNEISISAYCNEKEDGDEIGITGFIPDLSEHSQRNRHHGKPLRIAGDNLQIVPSFSSAMPPARQDADLVMTFIKYNREVLPELKRLSRDGLQKRGEHYLTLQELLKMELQREESLCGKEVRIKGAVKEVAGSLGGCAIVFDAGPDAFVSIMSKDDSADGIKVMLKPNDNESFRDYKATGELKYLGSDRWIVELYANKDVDVASVDQLGMIIKRYPNIRHLHKQITAIDNFVYERNGLDIFSKIASNKLLPIEIPPIESIEANPHFNLYDVHDSQVNALKMALGGSQISLIQGPPGTGKSTVIVDIIRNLVKRHKKVLVCTQSVAPIEELYFKLSGRKDRKQVNEPVKIDGYPLRCAYIRDDESIELSGSVVERRKALKDMMILVRKLKDMNETANKATLEELKMLKESLGEQNKEACGEVVRKFAKNILPHHSEVLNILSEYHHALNKEDVENFATEHRSLNLEAVDVVLGTCIGVGVNPLLRDVHFDTLIIDEAGKANYAESLVPMMMADEYVLVGDDKQLPPYTNSELVKEMAKKRLRDKDIEMEEENEASQYLASEIEDIMEDVGKSLFGDLRPRLPESNQIMLSKQFRMHPMIGDFVSKLFYDGKVVSAPKPNERFLNIQGLDNPIKFIDTSGMGGEARERRQGLSLYNDGEIQVIEESLLPMLEAAIESKKSIGILSPYGAQVKKMRERFPKLSKHIFTIDSIQGGEYDIVVFSFVRNTRTGSLNFVDDLRRLNVSFSRAKCNLIMVGHLDTLRNESLHKVDKEAVMSVYNEIMTNKIELVVHHGAMQRLYDDFPPELCPMIENIDEPYHVFENCRATGNGQFSAFYKGKLLSLYNPVLKNIPEDEIPENFNASLIGYVDEKPHTFIKPIGLWLTSQNSLRNFRFKAMVHATTSIGLILELEDKSLVSLLVPNPYRFSTGISVEVEVRGNRKFTIKTIDND